MSKDDRAILEIFFGMILGGAIFGFIILFLLCMGAFDHYIRGIN